MSALTYNVCILPSFDVQGGIHNLFLKVVCSDDGALRPSFSSTTADLQICLYGPVTRTFLQMDCNRLGSFAFTYRRKAIYVIYLGSAGYIPLVISVRSP